MADFSERSIIVTAAILKVSENLFVITMFFINHIYYSKWNIGSNRDLEEYEGCDWDVRIDLAVRPQVHMLQEKTRYTYDFIKMENPLKYAQCKILTFLPCPLFI